MKYYAFLLTGAALAFGAPQTYAADAGPQQSPPQTQSPVQAAQPLTAPPVDMQPAPASARGAAPYSGTPTLGDSGTMYSQREDESLAGIAPAAGAPDRPVAPQGQPANLAAKSKTVLQDIAERQNFSTLEKALNSSGAAESLNGDGPFTVFAPSNQAFDKLPDRSLNALLRPSERERLAKLVNYHVVAGLHDADSIRRDITEGGGSTTYQSMAGPNIRVTAAGNNFTLTDENGNVSTVIAADSFQANGIVHTVDTVIIPK